MAMTQVTVYYRDNTHDYVSDLRRMLDLLGRYDAPVYHSRTHFVNGVPSGVICQLTLRVRARSGGWREPLQMRIYKARRAHLADAVEETARLAMVRLARVHAADLAGTAYRLHPADSQIDPSPGQRDDLEANEEEVVAQLAGLALAQARHAERTATELKRVQQALDDARERIAQLEEASGDEGHAAETEDEEAEQQLELGVEAVEHDPEEEPEPELEADDDAVVPHTPDATTTPSPALFD